MPHENIWTFRTKNYLVAFDIEPELDLDLSWDEDGETAAGLDSGKYIAFVAHVSVTHIETGHIVGDSYLGNCVYESGEAFINHRGIRHYRPYPTAPEGLCGSYFSDMVREAIAEARKFAGILHLRRAA